MTRARPPDLADLHAAARRIKPFVRVTPLWPLGEGLRGKLESLQVTGSFKARGAFNHILALERACRRGVVTASSGNHGRAVAHVAHTLGLTAVVVVPEDVVAAKADAITRLGAELLRCGRTSEERLRLATALAAERGLHYVPPFDDPLIIAGAGSAGLEIVEQLPEVEVVTVPASGGGLIAGVTLAVKALRPSVRVIGVEPLGAERFARSRAAGERVTVPAINTVADGLRVVTPGELPYQISAAVDVFVSVADDELHAAVWRLFSECNLVVEPSGAASVAAAWRMHLGPRVVALVSGGNVELGNLRQVGALNS